MESNKRRTKKTQVERLARRTKKTQAERLADALKEIAINVTADDRKEAESLGKGFSKPNISKYLAGEVLNVDTAIKLLGFLRKRIANREKIIA